MVTLLDALLVLRPTAEPQRDFRLYDDGSGPAIISWTHNTAQPTPEEIAGVTDAQVATARAAREAMAAAAQLTAVDPLPYAVRLVVRVMSDRINAAFAAMGQSKPLLEADVNAAIAAGVAAGLGQPVRPD